MSSRPLILNKTFSAPALLASLLWCVAHIHCASAEITPRSIPQSAISEQMLFADDPSKWLTLKLVVPPAYPPELLGKMQTGYVDVDLHIDELGQVARVVSMKSVPPQPAFERAVSEVARYWLFYPAFTSECLPQQESGNIRVWFDIKDGKEHISVSARHSSEVPERVGPSPEWAQTANAREVGDALLKRFPREARRMNVDGAVWAILSVDSQSGETQSVNVTYILTRSSRLKRLFESAAADALQLSRFSPRGDASQPVFKVCREVYFFVR